MKRILDDDVEDDEHGGSQSSGFVGPEADADQAEAGAFGRAWRAAPDVQEQAELLGWMADDLDVAAFRALSRVAVRWTFTDEDEASVRAAGIRIEHVHAIDDPVIEHGAPRSQAAVRAGRAAWRVGPELEKLRSQLR